MRIAHPGRELLFAEGQLLGEISSEQGDVSPLAAMLHATFTGSMGANPMMLLCQKVPLILGRSASLRKAPSVGGFRLTPPISTIQRVFLRSDDQVGADGAQFAIDLVADISRDRDHRRGHGYTQGDGGAGQQLAPLLPPKRFVDEANEHGLLLLEHAAAGRNVRLLE